MQSVRTTRMYFCYGLWDGAFSYARKTNPQEADIKAYSYFVKAAYARHQIIGCSVTHKVHLMIDHVEWQMRNLEGGLGVNWKTGSNKITRKVQDVEHNFVQLEIKTDVQSHRKKQHGIHQMQVCNNRWVVLLGFCSRSTLADCYLLQCGSLPARG